MTKRFLHCAAALLFMAATVSADNWPQWRGPQLNGLSGETNLPVKWSTTENITWKLPLPERSGSTPIVWGDHVFLNVAEGRNLSSGPSTGNTGAVQWKRPLGGGNHADAQAEHVVALAGHRRHDACG